MALIQQLYRIERETKDLSAEERQRIRQERALPLLEDIRSWLDENVPRALRVSSDRVHRVAAGDISLRDQSVVARAE